MVWGGVWIEAEVGKAETHQSSKIGLEQIRKQKEVPWGLFLGVETMGTAGRLKRDFLAWSEI